MACVTIQLDIELEKYCNSQNLKADNKIFDYLFNIDGESYRKKRSKNFFGEYDRNTLKIKIGQEEYFIKKFVNKFNNKLFKKTYQSKSHQAKHERDAILELKKLDINTLTIAGYAEHVDGNDSKSFLITKAIEPNYELDIFCMKYIDYKDYFKLKRLLIKHIAKITRLLHKNGLNHRDYYICHYLIAINKLALTDDNINFNNINSDFLNSIFLIDLHRMQIRNKVPSRYIIKDLSAIMFSARGLKVTKTDYLRFIKEYLNCSNNSKPGDIKIAYKNNRIIFRKAARKAGRIVEKD